MLPAPRRRRSNARSPDAAEMKSFLAKNWLLIVLPMLIVAIAIAALIALGGSDPNEGFQYGL